MENMNFRIQDLAKTLIPGIVTFFLSFLLILTEEEFMYLSNLTKDTIAIWLIIFIAVVYTLGYFVDFIGSKLEHLYYKWFERPSIKLLNETSKLYKLSFSEEIIEFLCDIIKRSSHHPFEKESAKELFKCANVYKEYASTTAKERVLEYYYSKILSRNVSAALLFSFVVYLLFFLYNIANWQFNIYSLFIIPVFIFSGYRWTTFAHYYTRQVFYAACEPVLKKKI